VIHTRHSKFDYLAVADSNAAWGLNVTSAGFAEVPPHNPYPPDQHPLDRMFSWKNGRVLPDFSIVYITGGEGKFETKSLKEANVKAGTALLLFPDVWHRYAPNRTTGWKEHWVSFVGTQPRRLMKQGVLSPQRPILDIGTHETILSLYNQILDLIETQRIGYKDIIAALTYTIIAEVYSAGRREKFGGKEIEDIILQAKIYMADHVDKDLDCLALVEELHIGYSWFRQMFRQHTHLAPSQYFLILKLNKAKKMLVQSSMQIGAISSLLGFDSQGYFSKFFKKKTGMSPSDWRQMYQTRRE
jgi:AraC-like DNA-binding protein